MTKATIKKSVALLVGVFAVAMTSLNVYAQDKPVIEDDFIFFINGANVQIPTLDGTVVADPLDPTSGNRVFRHAYAGWVEGGFRWPSGGHRDSVGVNASAFTGENYGETDTLYFKLLSDTANRGRNDFIAFMDSDDGVMNVNDNPDTDLPFRLRWTIPSWAHNGEWHEFAIPLPPRTLAMLDSAKAGLKFNGDSLEVEVDSLFMNWNYAGAWANGSASGHWDQSDAFWKEFDWEAIKFFGRHIDHADGGADMFFDYFSIGVPPSELVDAPPTPLANINLANTTGENTVTWDMHPDAGGYNVYFSESEITDVVADGVTRLGTIPFDGTREVKHEITAPHPDLASGFTGFYAVTATSQFGSESAPTGASISGDANVTESYAVELDVDGIDAVYEAIFDEVIPSSEDMAALFPEGYYPFSIGRNDRFVIENGQGGDSDTDISAKFWLGFGNTDNELIVYAEVTDNAIVIPTSTVTTDAAWAYDSWEFGLGNYSPESFIISSTHSAFQRGENPDYQFRAGMYQDRAPFAHTSHPNGEIPNSQTIGDSSDTGYRLLTLINTVELTTSVDGVADKAFDFPESDEIKLYPLNLAINDADDPVTTRDTQISWSNRAGGDTWWNNPQRWQTVAFAGINKAYTGGNPIEDEPTATPFEFSLEQNYPNPFNPSTKIEFTLANASNVTLEVFNMLGQKVATLLSSEKLTAGKHSQTFNAANLASGMYVYRISAANFTQTRKMMLIK